MNFTAFFPLTLSYRLFDAANTDPFHMGDGMQLRLKHVKEKGILTSSAESETTEDTSRWSSFRILLQDLPLRIFSVAWLLFCFFFITYMQAEIQSNSTISKLQRRVDSLDDVVKVNSMFLSAKTLAKISRTLNTFDFYS